MPRQKKRGKPAPAPSAEVRAIIAQHSPAAARQRAGLSIEEVAKRMRLAPATVRRWERLWDRRAAGESVTLPTDYQARLYCRALRSEACPNGVPMDIWYTVPRRSKHSTMASDRRTI